jgi:hypothetical protein
MITLSRLAFSSANRIGAAGDSVEQSLTHNGKLRDEPRGI